MEAFRNDLVLYFPRLFSISLKIFALDFVDHENIYPKAEGECRRTNLIKWKYKTGNCLLFFPVTRWWKIMVIKKESWSKMIEESSRLKLDKKLAQRTDEEFFFPLWRRLLEWFEIKWLSWSEVGDEKQLLFNLSFVNIYFSLLIHRCWLVS